MKKVKIVVTEPEHLRALVKRAIAKHGPACDLNYIDVSRLTNMVGVFRGLAFNGDISGWDTGRVVNMACLFYDSPFTGDISGWNTSSLQNATRMFKDSKFNGDIHAWNMRQCQSFVGMFHGSFFNGNIDRWRIQGDVKMDLMFSNCPFRGDLSGLTLSPNSSCVNMFSPTFQGELPRAENLLACQKIYNQFFGGYVQLQEYLASTPFSGIHCDLLMTTNKRPSWATVEQHRWVKDQRSTAQAVGLDPQTMREVIAAQGQRYFSDASLLTDAIPFAFELPE